MENSFRITDRRESYEKKGKGRREERGWERLSVYSCLCVCVCGSTDTDTLPCKWKCCCCRRRRRALVDGAEITQTCETSPASHLEVSAAPSPPKKRKKKKRRPTNFLQASSSDFFTDCLSESRRHSKASSNQTGPTGQPRRRQPLASEAAAGSRRQISDSN